MSSQSMPCQEVRLSGAVIPASGGGILGSDSSIDRLLIGYGRSLLESRSFSAVVIASNDGGIQYEVNKLRLDTQLPLFCIADPRREDQVAPLRAFLGFGRSSGSWTAKLLGTLEPPPDMWAIRDIALSPDGQLLARSSYEKMVRVCMIPDGRSLASLEEIDNPGAVVFSPDGRLVATLEGGATIVRLWTLPGGQSCGCIQGKDNFKVLPDRRIKIFPLAFSPDGRLLATARHWEVSVWSVPEQKVVASLGRFATLYCWVTTLAFSPNGRWLATGATGGAVYLYRPSEDQALTILQENDGRGDIHSLGIVSLVFSPDGQFLAAGNCSGEVKIWRVSDCAPLAIAKGDGNLGCLAFSPDSLTLAVGTWRRLCLLSIPEGRRVAILPGEVGSVRSLVFSSDGRTLSALLDGSEVARVWTVPEGKLLLTFSYDRIKELEVGERPFCHSARLSPDGRFLATGDRDACVRLWRLPPEP